MAEAKPSVSEPELGHWEPLLKRFDRAWQQQCRPAIDDYLPENSTQRLAVLVELVHADLEYRLNGGEAVRVEEYLERYPELHGERAAVLELIAAERAWRRRRDPDLTAAEYLARFPQYQHELALAVGCCTAEGRRDHQSPDLESTIRGSATPLPMDPNVPDRIGDYAIDGILGQGGMGIVLRGKDPDFHRSLAIKVLGEKLRGHPEATRRFLDEARIMGQLQHPGIPPVHALGKLADGRPYFVMKRIKGETLAELLQSGQESGVRGQGSENTSPRMSPANPGDDNLPRFIAIFEQICQTLAYAHSRGVIHRDLKPHNVMVGAFGEVQVMDWGIAKIVTDQDSGIREIQPPDQTNFKRAEDTPETHPGQAIGTWAYIPPEQARGEVENLDPRADVFGLGGILCEILSGAPPFNRDRLEENRSLAMQGDLSEAFARLDRCGADAELIDLAKKCLAPKRDQRPSSAEIVAQAIAFYRHQVQARLHQAEIDRTTAEVQAAEERKRREVEEQKAALEQAKAREERRRRRMTLGLAASLLTVVVVGGAGIWIWQHQETLRHAERSFQEIRTQEAIASSLAQLPALHSRALWKEAFALLDQVDQQLGTDGPAELRDQVAQARRDTRFIQRLDEIRMEKLVIVGRRMYVAEAGPKYQDAFQGHGLDVLQGDAAELAAKLNASAVRDYLLAALDDWAVEDRTTWKRIMAVTAKATGQEWRTLLDGAWEDGEKLTALYDAVPLEQRTPGLILAVGRRLNKLGADGIRRVEDGLRQHPGDFWLHFAWGAAAGKERADACIGAYRAALAIRPHTPGVLHNLATMLMEKKDYDAAMAALKDVVRLDPKFAMTHHNLGIVLYEKKEYDAAIAAFKEAIRLDPKFALPHNGLGIVLHEKKEYEAASAELKEALRLDPNEAALHNSLGRLLHDMKEYDAAVAAYQEAIRLDPKDALMRNNLGAVLLDMKECDAASSELKEAIRLDPKYARAYHNLGNAMVEKKDYDAACAAYKEAIRLIPKFALTHHSLGNVLFVKKEYDAASAAFKEAIRLDPKYVLTHNNLGMALHEKKEYAAAIAAFKEAIRLDPSFAFAYANLGLVYGELGRFSDSVEALRTATTLKPNHAWIQSELRLSEQGLALDHQLAGIRQGTEKPKTAAEAVNLATFALAQFNKEYALAFHLFTDAFAAEPKLVPMNRYHAACAALQFAAGNDKRVRPVIEESHHLRQQARTWLTADLDRVRKSALSKTPAEIQQAQAFISRWSKDPNLTPVRDLAWLKAMPDPERQAWTKLWADMEQLSKEIRATFTETSLKGTVTAKEREHIHELKMTAGNTYMIDMTSAQFDTYLRLEDAKKKVLAENDDIDEKANNLNSRLVFTPSEDGVYRLVATSFQQRGVGAYTLTILEFQGNKE